MSVREPILKPVAIAALRPTQMTVGIARFKEKRKRWRDESKKKEAEFLGKHMIPVVLRAGGPPLRHRSITTWRGRCMDEGGSKMVLVAL